MKNKTFYLLVLILLIGASYFFFSDNKKTINKKEGALVDFEIEDTTSIDKIFIVDAGGKSVTLSKKDNQWIVNNKYIARPNNISILMKTFHEIRVKSPVPNAAFNNIVKRIATKSTKVEIYQGESEPSKIYYVGGPTQNHQGTYMLLEKNNIKSTVPFIMHIPGFYGYLSTRFFTNGQQWRDPVVFNYQPNEIKRLTVKYTETPEESFIIENNNNELKLIDYETNTPISNFNTLKVQEYLKQYQKVYYEMVDEESSPSKIDSVLATEAYFTIKVTDTNNNSNQITAYHMPNFRKLLDDQGNEHLYDIDRMYGYLNNDLFTFIQFATFDNIRYPKSYFTKN